MDEQEPAWLTSAVDQRLALIRESGAHTLAGGMDLILTPLTEPKEDATDDDRIRWDRSCDNCGVFCGKTRDFWTGSVTRYLGKTQVVLTFGTCTNCKQAP